MPIAMIGTTGQRSKSACRSLPAPYALAAWAWSESSVSAMFGPPSELEPLQSALHALAESGTGDRRPFPAGDATQCFDVRWSKRAKDVEGRRFEVAGDHFPLGEFAFHRG